MHQRVAIAWSLLLVLLLLLGLLLIVVGFGVVRHLRRQRGRREKEAGGRGTTQQRGAGFDPEDEDWPGSPPGRRAPEDTD